MTFTFHQIPTKKKIVYQKSKLWCMNHNRNVTCASKNTTPTLFKCQDTVISSNEIQPHLHLFNAGLTEDELTPSRIEMYNGAGLVRLVATCRNEWNPSLNLYWADYIQVVFCTLSHHGRKTIVWYFTLEQSSMVALVLSCEIIHPSGNIWRRNRGEEQKDSWETRVRSPMLHSCSSETSLSDNRPICFILL